MSNAAIAGIILIAVMILMFSRKVTLPVAACIGAVAMVLAGQIEMKTMLQQYSSSTIAIMFGMMIIGGGLFHTGVAIYFGKAVSKIAKTERGIVFALVAFGTVMSAFMSRSTCFFMFLPIVVSIAVATDTSLQRLLLPFVTGCSLGQQMTLVGCSTNLAVNNAIIELGHEGLGFLEMTPFGILQFILVVPTILFVGLKILPNEKVIPEMATLAENNDVEKITPKMIVSAVIMLVTMVLMALDLAWLPSEMCALLGALATILTGCLDTKQALKSINWNSLFMIAGMTAVAKGIQASGLTTDLIGPLFESIKGASPFVVLMVIFLACSIATQFMNDAALAGILGPLLIPFVDIVGVPAHVLGSAAIFGISAAMITATSTSTASPTIEVGKYSLVQFAKFGFLMLAVKTVAVVIYFLAFMQY